MAQRITQLPPPVQHEIVTPPTLPRRSLFMDVFTGTALTAAHLTQLGYSPYIACAGAVTAFAAQTNGVATTDVLFSLAGLTVLLADDTLTGKAIRMTAIAASVLAIHIMKATLNRRTN